MREVLNKLKLLKGLLRGDFAYAGPSYICVDATNRCNLHCLCCAYHSPLSDKAVTATQDIDPELFKRLCRDAKALGTNMIVIQGEGEPLLHPGIFDLIETAKAGGFITKMFTNGTLLDDLRIKAILDSGLDSLKLTLWASSPEQYEKNYPGSDKANFTKVKDGLKRLAESKSARKQKTPLIELRHPINRHNYQTLEQMVDFSQDYGCDKIVFSVTHATHGQEIFRSFMLTPEEEKIVCASLNRLKPKLKSLSIQHNLNEILTRYRLGEAVWEKTPCYIGWIHARIKTDGSALACNPCENASMGNLYQNGFQDIWNNEQIRGFRSKAMTFQGCASLSQECDCHFCCHAWNNYRIHRIVKWLLPFNLHFAPYL
jgi:MoaA/NifB/PqqE/SkfB family radical SAM enzyme